MEKVIRAFLLRLLGFENYLGLVSRIYLRLVANGFFKKKYPELFYLRKIIQEGFVCLDIGANVGYYSVFLSRYAGMKGRVHAVEPVALFADIFKRNTRKMALPNIELYQTALGDKKGTVTMGTPMINGVLRHGLTSVIDPSQAEGMHTYSVPLEVPDHLFSSLTRLDFIKCDVEGYEIHLFPHLKNTIARFNPLIQVEITPAENKQILIDLLKPMGYHICKLQQEELIPMSDAEALHYSGGDFYFVPAR